MEPVARRQARLHAFFCVFAAGDFVVGAAVRGFGRSVSAHGTLGPRRDLLRASRKNGTQNGTDFGIASRARHRASARRARGRASPGHALSQAARGYAFSPVYDSGVLACVDPLVRADRSGTDCPACVDSARVGSGSFAHGCAVAFAIRLTTLRRALSDERLFAVCVVSMAFDTARVGDVARENASQNRSAPKRRTGPPVFGLVRYGKRQFLGGNRLEFAVVVGAQGSYVAALGANDLLRHAAHALVQIAARAGPILFAVVRALVAIPTDAATAAAVGLGVRPTCWNPASPPAAHRGTIVGQRRTAVSGDVLFDDVERAAADARDERDVPVGAVGPHQHVARFGRMPAVAVVVHVHLVARRVVEQVFCISPPSQAPFLREVTHHQLDALVLIAVAACARARVTRARV